VSSVGGKLQNTAFVKLHFSGLPRINTNFLQLKLASSLLNILKIHLAPNCSNLYRKKRRDTQHREGDL
jgi:hypothetical protein